MGGLGVGVGGQVSSITPEASERQKTIPSPQRSSFTLHLTPTPGGGRSAAPMKGKRSRFAMMDTARIKNIHNDVELFCKRESQAAAAKRCYCPLVFADRGCSGRGSCSSDYHKKTQQLVIQLSKQVVILVEDWQSGAK